MVLPMSHTGCDEEGACLEMHIPTCLGYECNYYNYCIPLKIQDYYNCLYKLVKSFSQDLIDGLVLHLTDFWFLSAEVGSSLQMYSLHSVI